mgnify:CR=1 FL=1
MHKLHPHKTGLALGSFNALIHLVWVLLMSMGWAAGKLNFFLAKHFLSIQFDVLEFSWKGGLMLIILAFIGGYIAGAVFSFVWNKVAAH